VRVRLRLYLPMLAQVMGGKEQTVEFPGTTVRDLLDHLMQRHGRRAREALLDENGELDLVIQMVVNEAVWISRQELDTDLQDGDEVTIMVPMAGGRGRLQPSLRPPS
jgi:MoaD family protein